MNSELLISLLNELCRRRIFDKYRVMFPKKKLNLEFFINLTDEDIKSIINLESDIGKILKINELLVKKDIEQEIRFKILVMQK